MPIQDEHARRVIFDPLWDVDTSDGGEHRQLLERGAGEFAILYGNSQQFTLPHTSQDVEGVISGFSQTLEDRFGTAGNEDPNRPRPQYGILDFEDPFLDLQRWFVYIPQEFIDAHTNAHSQSWWSATLQDSLSTGTVLDFPTRAEFPAPSTARTDRVYRANDETTSGYANGDAPCPLGTYYIWTGSEYRQVYPPRNDDGSLLPSWREMQSAHIALLEEAKQQITDIKWTMYGWPFLKTFFNPATGHATSQMSTWFDDPEREQETRRNHLRYGPIMEESEWLCPRMHDNDPLDAQPNPEEHQGNISVRNEWAARISREFNDIKDSPGRLDVLPIFSRQYRLVDTDSSSDPSGVRSLEEIPINEWAAEIVQPIWRGGADGAALWNAHRFHVNNAFGDDSGPSETAESIFGRLKARKWLWTAGYFESTSYTDPPGGTNGGSEPYGTNSGWIAVSAADREIIGRASSKTFADSADYLAWSYRLANAARRTTIQALA